VLCEVVFTQGPVLQLERSVRVTIATAFRAEHRVRALKKWVKVAWVLTFYPTSFA
jgi:hypothetical protein